MMQSEMKPRMTQVQEFRFAQKHGEPDEILLEDWIPNPETAI